MTSEKEPDQGYQSLSIGAEVFQHHCDRKEELGMTWTEYIDEEARSYSSSTSLNYVKQRAKPTAF